MQVFPNSLSRHRIRKTSILAIISLVFKYLRAAFFLPAFSPASLFFAYMLVSRLTFLPPVFFADLFFLPNCFFARLFFAHMLLCRLTVFRLLFAHLPFSAPVLLPTCFFVGLLFARLLLSWPVLFPACFFAECFLNGSRLSACFLPVSFFRLIFACLPFSWPVISPTCFFPRTFFARNFC